MLNINVDMLNARVLVTGLLLMGSVMAQKPTSWTTAQKEWALGTIAILSELNHNRFDLLAGAENPADVAAKDREFLIRLWQINSREDLLREIKLRLAHSEDAPRIGWNYPLVINLARWGYVVGYLREDEAWEIIMPAAQVLQQTFASWQEMGRAYLEARDAWLNSRDFRKRREGEWAYRTVALNPNGPWRKYPWNLDIGGSRKITMTVEKAAWVMINPHPDGLICVRLGVPDHTDAGDHTDQQYLAAIENTIGCHPRVTGNSYYRQDWTLDAECEVKSAVHGSQLIAKFRMEEIASKLRGEGFTELFSYLQHEPHGSSELVRGSYDSFVQDGLQWYIERRSLKMPVEDAELAYGIPERQVTPLERKNPGPACTIDEAGDREQEIDGAASDYVKRLLGNDPGAAFDAMSKEGRKALTRDQLATAARMLQEFNPQHINVLHRYVIELGSKIGTFQSSGASPIEDEPLERVVCGNNPEKPDGWVSVAVTNDLEQAYVVFSADSTNHELALTAWLVRQGNQWMVHGFSFSLATLGSKGPIELWEQARAERRRGHQLNGVLLFGAAEDLVDRGPYFTLGIQSRILQDAPTFVKPAELQGMPPYLWRTSQRTWKVLNVSLTASGGKIFVMISHEVGPWQSDDQVDGWNKELLFYFKSRFPEYSEVFAGLVANAYEQGTKRQYRTVDDTLRPPDFHLVAGLQ